MVNDEPLTYGGLRYNLGTPRQSVVKMDNVTPTKVVATVEGEGLSPGTYLIELDAVRNETRYSSVDYPSRFVMVKGSRFIHPGTVLDLAASIEVDKLRGLLSTAPAVPCADSIDHD